MDSGPSFFVRRHDKVHGPFVREQLRALAAGGHLDPASEIALAAGGPWARLETLPALRAILTGDAPAAFERANTDAQPPIDLRDLIAAAQPDRAPAAAPPAPLRPVSAAHDVHSLLRFNLAVEKLRGLHEPKPLAARRSRRRRDYVVLLAVIGAVIFGILLAECYAAVQIQVLAARMAGQFWPVFRDVVFHSPIFAWGLACLAAIAVALGWVMFGVMDDY